MMVLGCGQRSPAAPPVAPVHPAPVPSPPTVLYSGLPTCGRLASGVGGSPREEALDVEALTGFRFRMTKEEARTTCERLGGWTVTDRVEACIPTAREQPSSVDIQNMFGGHPAAAIFGFKQAGQRLGSLARMVARADRWEEFVDALCAVLGPPTAVSLDGWHRRFWWTTLGWQVQANQELRGSGMIVYEQRPDEAISPWGWGPDYSVRERRYASFPEARPRCLQACQQLYDGTTCDSPICSYARTDECTAACAARCAPTVGRRLWCDDGLGARWCHTFCPGILKVRSEWCDPPAPERLTCVERANAGLVRCRGGCPQ